MGKTAAVVVTYNRSELLVQAVEALKKQTYKDMDILIVNNASTDNTEAAMKPYADRNEIIYFNTGENIGGAGGFNYGMKKAYEMGYDYFWLMDDDSIPDSDALEKLFKADRALNGQYGYLASYVYWKDGTACKMNAPEVSESWLAEKRHVRDNLVKISRSTFVGFFTKREVVEKVGLPVKEFFIWSDDTNYCWRCNKYYSGYICLDSCIEHRIASNVDADLIYDDTGRLGRYVYAFRNRAYNYRMEDRQKEYRRYVLKKIFHILTRSKDHRLKRINVMLKGAVKGRKFNPPIEYVGKQEKKKK